MKNKIVIALTFSLFCFTSAYAKNNNIPDNTVRYDTIAEQAYQKFKSEKAGDVADYIPALAKYSPDNYAVVIATVDGKIYSAGDKDKLFPLESLSKVFTLAMVMDQQGSEVVLEKLGANATGLPFNSGLAIELRPDRPQNPLVNAGAISAVSLIKAKTPDDRWQQIMENMEAYADTKLTVNDEVYRSESETNQHNQALARLMQSYGMLYGNPDEAVDLYTRQCSVDATTVDLAKMGAVLAKPPKTPAKYWQRWLLPGYMTVPAPGCIRSVFRRKVVSAAVFWPWFRVNMPWRSIPRRWIKQATVSGHRRLSAILLRKPALIYISNVT